MGQIQLALQALSNRGIHIAHWQALNGGINSRLIQLTSTKGQKFALKFYRPNNSGDQRNRLQAEKDFLTYVNNTKASNRVPKLIFANTEQNWSLLSWLDGQSLDDLGKDDLAQVVDFIAHINPRSTKLYLPLQPASEACLGHKVISQNLSYRLTRLTAVEPRTAFETEVCHWIKHTLETDVYHQLACFEQMHSSSAWQPEAIRLIASPSDVGIHNTLTLNRKLYFLDFEYSGLDDLAKLICDWVLQPRQPLNRATEDSFLDNLQLRTQHLPQNWIVRYKHLKPILHLKWCIIMLNKHLENKLYPAQFDEVKKYYARMIDMKNS